MPHRSYLALVEQFRKILVVADTVTIFVTEILVLLFRHYRMDMVNKSGFVDFIILAMIPVLWLLFLSNSRAWESELLRSSLDFYEKPLKSGINSIIVISAFAYLVKEPISRITTISILISITLNVLVVRFILRRSFIAKLIQTKRLRILIVAPAAEIRDFNGENILNESNKVDFITHKVTGKISELDWKAIFKELVSGDFAGLIISQSLNPDAEIFKNLSSIQSKRHFEMFIYSEHANLQPRLRNTSHNKLIKVARPSLIGHHAFAKRSIDIFISFLALVLLSPLLLLVACLVKVTSTGPVLYVDRRIGKNNQLFLFPKFRSMYQGSESRRESLIGAPDASTPGKYRQDPRITPFGRFIRRWSIDELPQLWCVLIGTMSIVGPRPIIVEEAKHVDESNEIRFIAKPGLTGLWQISGRKETLWQERMRQDSLYIDSWSLTTDTLIIAKTFGVIVSGKGAM